MMIKIALLGICVCIIGVFLRQYQSSFIIVLNIAFSIIVMIFVLDHSLQSFESIADLFSVNSLTSKIFICLYKAAFICILSKIACDICKESGGKVIADIIEISSKIMLLIMVIPYIESIIKTATAFVK